MRRARLALAGVLLVTSVPLGTTGPSTATAQTQDATARALELERRGDHAGAADAYRRVLEVRPADLSALLGLERSLTPLNRLPEMTGLVRAAAQSAPSPAVFSLAVRVSTADRQPDSARAAVERWAALEPRSEAPFQEWGMAAIAARDRGSARAAYVMGRQKLGRGDALAAEMGQLAAIEGDYASAAREWVAALGVVPGYRSSALAVLAQVPAEGRPALLRELSAQRGFHAERIAAGLQARWGDPVAGARRLVAAVPEEQRPRIEALQEFLEELRGPAGGELALARGIVLELLAERSAGAQRARVRLDAAQAFADGGDQAAARRMLGSLAGDPTTTPGMAASATSTLVGILIEEGKLDDADRRFAELTRLLGEEERQRLVLRLAEGWLRVGNLDRAAPLLAADSSVDGLALRGRIQLYQGDLAGASETLRAAGPFAGDRSQSTERAAILGLLQMLEVDSLPELGRALLRLERRDSVAAAVELESLAQRFSPAAGGGGAELLLLASKVRAGLRQHAEAERGFRTVMAAEAPASAAAAALALGHLLVETGRRPEAVVALEHLLLTWPTSAVVPQARRLLDVARGAVPPV